MLFTLEEDSPHQPQLQVSASQIPRLQTWFIASCAMGHSLWISRLNSVQDKHFVPSLNNLCN